MNWCAKWILFALFSLFAEDVAALPSFLPPDFAFWMWQSSVVVGSWLYVDGGEIWARWGGPSVNASAVFNMQTIAIDLSVDWSTTSVGATIVTNKSSSMPIMRYPDIFYDPTKEIVLSTGGMAYGVDTNSYNFTLPPQLWGFEPVGTGTAPWQLQQVGPSGQFPLAYNKVLSYTATSAKGHYSMGGFVPLSVDSDVGVEYIPLADMVDFTFANQTWLNQSVFSQRFAEGRAEFLPMFGEEGIVVMFGGKWPSDASLVGTSIITGLSTILVYDVHTNRFFTQPASNAPIGRFSFCSVAAGANSSSNATSEIFMFGGTRGTTTTDNVTAEALAQVYILTLPAFHWIAVPPAGSPLRAYHTCSVIGNRQMLSVGGIQDLQNTNAMSTLNDTWGGLRIFDMTTLQWKTDYDHAALPYQPSSLVMDYYANSPRYPAAWSDSSLADIFTVQNSTSSSIPLAGTGSKSPGSAKKLSTGVIAGIAVCAAAVAVIVAALILWLKRKQRKPWYSSPAVVTDINEYYGKDSNLKDRTALVAERNGEMGNKGHRYELNETERSYELPAEPQSRL